MTNRYIVTLCTTRQKNAQEQKKVIQHKNMQLAAILGHHQLRDSRKSGIKLHYVHY